MSFFSLFFETIVANNKNIPLDYYIIPISLFLLRARKTGCRARLHKPIDNDDSRHFVKKGKSHMHAGDARKVGKKRVMSKLKNLAKTTKHTTRQIISESIVNVKKATAAVLPSEKSLVRMIQRYRGSNALPENPRDLSELNIPDEFRKTVKGENFLLYDSSEHDDYDGGRFLVFATKENLHFLSLCERIYMDGTFSVVPVLFTQLYTIHGKH